MTLAWWWKDCGSRHRPLRRSRWFRISRLPTLRLGAFFRISQGAEQPRERLFSSISIVWDICPPRSEAALVSKPNASEAIRHPRPNDPARLSTFRLPYANVPLPVQGCCLVRARSSLRWRTVAAACRLSAHSQSISSRSFPLPAPFLSRCRNNPVFGGTRTVKR